MRRSAIIPLVTLLAISAPAHAEPTPVIVRVISQDAKFVGDGMGGARVSLRDARTGRVMANGVTKGGTDDTDQIMKSIGRSPLRASAEAAAFFATLDIDRPTLVNLEVEGPLSRPGSIIKVSSQRWLMPGEAVTAGNGWMVELPGLAITPDVSVSEGRIHIAAKVELMCGCPITPGGLWDAADYEVTASLWRGNRRVEKANLAFVRAPGGYEGALPITRRGNYRLVLFARNRMTGNTGMTQVQVRPR